MKGMKLSMLAIVNRTVGALTQVDRDIAAVELGQYVVSIAGQGNDEALAAVAKSVLLSELAGRRASLLRDLESYGVDVTGA